MGAKIDQIFEYLPNSTTTGIECGKSTTIFQLYHYIYIGKGLQIYLGPHSRDRLVKYPIIKVGENPINTLVLCSRCHMIIDLKQMSSGKEQKKNWTENNGTKKTTFFCL